MTGCTVHLVDDGVDTGPILAQAAVPIREDDDETTLQRRIQTQEHRLLPAVMQAIACNQLRQEQGQMRLLGLEPDAEGLGWRMQSEP
jgi:phosphoribosylglycinamide formyltransferase-1